MNTDDLPAVALAEAPNRFPRLTEQMEITRKRPERVLDQVPLVLVVFLKSAPWKRLGHCGRPWGPIVMILFEDIWIIDIIDAKLYAADMQRTPKRQRHHAQGCPRI